MTVAAIDRNIHHATIEIEGESYRKKTERKKTTHFSTKTGKGNCRRPDRLIVSVLKILQFQIIT